MLYPLQFRPRLKERIWGGKALAAKGGPHKRIDPDKKYGESWEISGVQGDISIVKNGSLKGNNLQELIEVYMGDLVGDRIYEKFGVEFPLLVKYIDTQDLLSIQVHPDDRLAAERHNAYGKTEMWYVVSAEPGAVLYLGFREGVTREQYEQAVAEGTLPDLLNKIETRAGDAWYIPAGTIHAIGKGVRLVEIQQTSDVTYRVFDWNRTDAKGHHRQLHTELAIDAIRFDHDVRYNITRPAEKNRSVELIHCPYFSVNLIDLDGTIDKNLSACGTFVIYICTEGKVQIVCNCGTLTLEAGEVVLIPAEEDQAVLTGTGTLLEVYPE